MVADEMSYFWVKKRFWSSQTFRPSIQGGMVHCPWTGLWFCFHVLVVCWVLMEFPWGYHCPRRLLVGWNIDMVTAFCLGYPWNILDWQICQWCRLFFSATSINEECTCQSIFWFLTASANLRNLSQWSVWEHSEKLACFIHFPNIARLPSLQNFRNSLLPQVDRFFPDISWFSWNKLCFYASFLFKTI